jgi:hypothetical protein
LDAGAASPLKDFLVSASKPVDPALLPPPTGSELTTDKDSQIKKRSSGRLAAKPSAGRSTMEKAQLVLLKKGGFLLEEASPQAADLQWYRKMYSKTLPPNFINAVTALVEKDAGGKYRPVELGLMAA